MTEPDARSGADASALLILVHGSPRASANAQVFQIAEQIRQSSEYATVEVGFLECNEPSIPAAIEQCVARGAKRIVAVPYFLHTGKHVAVDIPAIFEQAALDYPAVELLLANYLGQSELLTEILTMRIRDAFARPL